MIINKIFNSHSNVFRCISCIIAALNQLKWQFSFIIILFFIIIVAYRKCHSQRISLSIRSFTCSYDYSIGTLKMQCIGLWLWILYGKAFCFFFHSFQNDLPLIPQKRIAINDHHLWHSILYTLFTLECFSKRFHAFIAFKCMSHSTSHIQQWTFHAVITLHRKRMQSKWKQQLKTHTHTGEVYTCDKKTENYLWSHETFLFLLFYFNANNSIICFSWISIHQSYHSIHKVTVGCACLHTMCQCAFCFVMFQLALQSHQIKHKVYVCVCS